MIHWHNKVRSLRRNLIVLLVSTTLLLSCGDPVTTAVVAQVVGAGVGGTGIVRGIITGFGSVFVNGVEFKTDNAVFDVDGNLSASQNKLSIGMLVTINGTINADGITGTATALKYDDELEGPLLSPPSLLANSNNQKKSFSIFGNKIIVDSISTRFEGVSFTALAVSDVLEISGYRNTSNDIIATLVKKTGGFIAGFTVVELKGNITSLGLTQFSLDSAVTVNYSPSTNIVTKSGVLADALFVEVKGVLQLDGSITAQQIEQKNMDISAIEGLISLSGVVSDFVNASNFKVNGVAIDATSATEFEPSNTLAILANDVFVEVEGSEINGVFVAKSIELELNNIKLNGVVASVSSNGFTLSYPNIVGAIAISLNSSTQFEDGTSASIDNFSLQNLNTSDFIELSASLIDGKVIAEKIKREDVDEFILQGQVEAINAGVSLTVLGIEYRIDGTTDFDSFINSAAFFNAISINDSVRVTDADGNGIADKLSKKD